MAQDVPPAPTSPASALSVDDRRGWTSDSFAEVMRARAQAATGQRKGDRTKARLRAATVEALEAIGYRNMTVADICRGAEVTPAVLYLYYDSKPAIVLDVLTEFLNEFFATAKSPRRDNLFEAIRLANLRWLRLARANAGIIRCLIQASDDEPSFARLYSEANHRWYQRSVSVWSSRFASTGFDKQAALLSAYVLGGLLDEFARLLFVSPDEHLTRLVGDLALDDEAIAEYVTVIWYRALTAREPQRPASLVSSLFRPLRELKARLQRPAP